MGILRDASPEYAEGEMDGHKVMFPSVFFGVSDWPEESILVDDINENVLVKHPTQGFDIFTYDEYDAFIDAGRRGARAGKLLKKQVG